VWRLFFGLLALTSDKAVKVEKRSISIMSDQSDAAVSLFTDVVGAVNDVEKTLETAPSHEKKAAAMTALKDAINITAKDAPGTDAAQVGNIAGQAVDLAVELKNVLGLFRKKKTQTKPKHQVVPAKKSA
jgi:hypothetical protein